MAKDWDKLAGERGREVSTSRLGRLMKVGRLGMAVGAGNALRKVSGALVPGAKSDRRVAADERFHRAQAEKVLRVLGEMKGATMKVGQILSSDPDLLPPEYLDTLTSLQHQAPPMTWRTIKGVVEDAFDCPIEVAFRSFDPEPIGSASIGQVHRGVLASGEEVAVKIQYPGIDATLESDLRNLGSLLTLGRVVLDKQRVERYLHEVREALLQEADYVAEGRNLARFHDIFASSDRVRVPRPFPEWTRRNVLTMEYIAGTKLDEALAARPVGPERDELLELFVETYAWMFHDLGELHADPHPGNFILDPEGRLAILDFGCVKTIDRRLSDGILDILDACWQHDDLRAATLYRDLGFGRTNGHALFDPDLLGEYHELVLSPYLGDAPFDFGAWELRAPMQRMFLEHPSFLRLTPPAGLIMVFRVMGGIKGLLNKLDCTLNVHRMAVDVARRNGRLTAEPRLEREPDWALAARART